MNDVEVKFPYKKLPYVTEKLQEHIMMVSNIDMC